MIEINCLACKHSLYQTGEVQETTVGVYVICRYCATVYIMNYDYLGDQNIYLQPVKLSQKGFDESFIEPTEKSEDTFEALKDKIQNTKSVNEFLKSLE